MCGFHVLSHPFVLSTRALFSHITILVRVEGTKHQGSAKNTVIVMRVAQNAWEDA